MRARRAILKFATCSALSFGLCASAQPIQETFAAEPVTASTCPTREAVAAAARVLLRPELTPSRLEAEIDVVDAGARFSVGVRGQKREYADRARDCQERTHTAAVFVALTLSPPELGSADPGSRAAQALEAAGSQAAGASGDQAKGSGSEPKAQNSDPRLSPKGTPAPRHAARPSAGGGAQPATKPTPSPSSSRQGAPPSLTPSRRRESERAPAAPRGFPPSALAVELGLLGALAPRADSTLLVAGAELRGAFSLDRWGVSLGLALPSPSTLELGRGLRVKQQRLAADVSARLIWQAAQLSGAFDLGFLLASYRLTRDGTTPAGGDRGFEVGGRAGASLELLPSAITPFLRGLLEYVPVTRKIAVEPRGIVGNTPAIWLGASLGVSGKFR